MSKRNSDSLYSALLRAAEESKRGLCRATG
jgi:hypothetical protein